MAATFAETTQRTRRGRRHRQLLVGIRRRTGPSLTGGLVTVARQLGGAQADLRAIRGRWATWARTAFGRGRTPATAAGCSSSTMPTTRPYWTARLGGIPRVTVENTVTVPCPRMEPAGRADSRRGPAIVTTPDAPPRPGDATPRYITSGCCSEAQAARGRWTAPPGEGAKRPRELARRPGGLPLPLRIAGSDLDSDRHPADIRRLHAWHLDHSDHRHRPLTSRPRIRRTDRQPILSSWRPGSCRSIYLAAQGFPQARPLLRVLSCFAWSTPPRDAHLTVPRRTPHHEHGSPGLAAVRSGGRESFRGCPTRSPDAGPDHYPPISQRGTATRCWSSR